MIKRFNYRIYPTNYQQQYFQNIFGSCRFVYNWALEIKNKDYEEKKKNTTEGEKIKSLSIYDISKLLTKLKTTVGYEWLNEPPSICLQWSLNHLDTAYKNFYRKLKLVAKGLLPPGEAGFPCFKNKYGSKKTFSFHQGYLINQDKSFMTVPKAGKLKVNFHRRFEGKYKASTIMQAPSGKYYVSIVVDDSIPPVEKRPPENLLGVDHGVRKALTLSNGNVFSLDLDFGKETKKKKKLQKQLAKKKKGSKNYGRQKIRIAKIEERISFKRESKINNMANDLALYLLENDYGGVIIRDYDIKNMTRKITPSKGTDGEFLKNGRAVQRKINKSILNSSLGMVRTKLTAKLEECGLNVFTIKASESKTTNKCNKCGEEKDIEINLKTRLLECKKCGMIEDIDFNAAKNIKLFFEKDFVQEAVE